MQKPTLSRPFVPFKAYYFPIRASISVCVMLLLAACATTVPETDTVAPEIRLTITGSGVCRQEMSNPPRAAWTGPGGTQLFDLQPGAEYSFVLLVSDQGGVERANLRMPREFTLSEVAPAAVEQTTTAIEESLTVRGSRSAPVTGLTIRGKFHTPELSTILSMQFFGEADDFGGASGRSNQRFLTVDATVLNR